MKSLSLLLLFPFVLLVVVQNDCCFLSVLPKSALMDGVFDVSIYWRQNPYMRTPPSIQAFALRLSCIFCIQKNSDSLLLLCVDMQVPVGIIFLYLVPDKVWPSFFEKTVGLFNFHHSTPVLSHRLLTLFFNAALNSAISSSDLLWWTWAFLTRSNTLLYLVYMAHLALPIAGTRTTLI